QPGSEGLILLRSIARPWSRVGYDELTNRARVPATLAPPPALGADGARRQIVSCQNRTGLNRSIEQFSDKFALPPGPMAASFFVARRRETETRFRRTQGSRSVEEFLVYRERCPDIDDTAVSCHQPNEQCAFVGRSARAKCQILASIAHDRSIP